MESCKNGHDWEMVESSLLMSTQNGMVQYGTTKEKKCAVCDHVFDYDLEDDEYGIPRPQLRQMKRV